MPPPPPPPPAPSLAPARTHSRLAPSFARPYCCVPQVTRAAAKERKRIMPGVKANTQKKGGEKEAVGGGGAAGKAARLGGGNKVSCAICKAEVNGNSKVQLSQHQEAKHGKMTFEQCWPGWTEPS